MAGNTCSIVSHAIGQKFKSCSRHQYKRAASEWSRSFLRVRFSGHANPFLVRDGNDALVFSTFVDQRTAQ